MNCFESKRVNLLRIIMLLLGSIIFCSAYSWEQGPVHAHGGNHQPGHGHYHGHDEYYDHGVGVYGWGFPNVIINVPAEHYYTPICEDVEVCDFYGECWFERRCH